jgi:hypothetical protein
LTNTQKHSIFNIIKEQESSKGPKMKKEIKTSENKSAAIFAKSVSAIMAKRSTGNAKLDALGSKILYAIHDKRLTFVEDEGSFEGSLGQAEISVYKVAHGKKSTRTVLNVAGIEIQGEFAARAYKMADSQVNKTGRKSIVVDEAKVDEVCSLLD